MSNPVVTEQALEHAKVLDATKMKSYMRCPRKYFYQHVLGWNFKDESHDLIFGRAWHDALEVLMLSRCEAIEEALTAFLAEWRQYYTEEEDNLYAPKTLDNALRGLTMWANNRRSWFNENEVEVLHVETSGSVPVSADADGEILWHYKMDGVIKINAGSLAGGAYAYEHKTTKTSNLARYERPWPLNVQVGGYVHALRSMGISGVSRYGAIIDAAYITNPPRVKKDGTPYANDTDIKFLHIPCEMAEWAVEQWRVTIKRLMEDRDTDYMRLMEEHPDDPIMRSFPCNFESCGDFGGCPYIDLCSHWANPLAKHQTMPIEFEKKYWNPHAKQETTDATTDQS